MQAAFQQALAQIGITVAIRQFSDPYATFGNVSKNIAANFGIPLSADYPDPFGFYSALQGAGIIAQGNFNWSLIGLTPAQAASLGIKGNVRKVPSLDAAVAKCERLSGALRLSCFAGVDRTMSGQIVPWVPLFKDVTVTVVGQAVKAPPPLPSIHELANTLARFNFWLFGWPLSLVFVGFFPRTAAGFRLFLGCAAVLLVYAGISAATISTTGPAHYSELAPALVILSAAGFVHLLELSAGPHAPVWAPRFIASVPAMATLCAFLTFLPIYGRSLRASSELVQAPYEIVEQQVPDRAIVFVQSLPATIVPPYSWAYYRRNNRLDLSDRVLFVNFLGEKNKEFMKSFPDRVPYAMGMDGAQLVLTRLSP